MPKKSRRNSRAANPRLRHRSHVPAPPSEEVEARLAGLLTPATFAAFRTKVRGLNLRDRLLTLPAMTALVLSLVYRQVASLSELLRMLESEGLLWLEPFEVSKQALSRRLDKIPAVLFAGLFRMVIGRMSGDEPPRPPVLARWKAELNERFGAVWTADGSTLEALRRRVSDDGGGGLAGRMMVIVNAFTHKPVDSCYDPDPGVNDKAFEDWLLERLPEGGLLVYDLGFFCFQFFDAFTDQRRYFVTRQRSRTACRTVRTLGSGPHHRDEIIEMGLHRSNPCRHRVRMVSVLWGATWHRYLTNVLDPSDLPAQAVCELYRERWRIEEAFLITKRLLGLSYLWTGSRNSAEIQIYATWIFHAVLMDLCAELAMRLERPLDRISVEMVFRGLYHYNRALQRGEEASAVEYLADRNESLAIVKEERKRHRQTDSRKQAIWGELLS